MEAEKRCVEYDAIVIGGGFYGCAIALHLAQSRRRVLLLERAPALLTRASFVNQARIHTGYHYPRSFRTAASSRENLARFLRDYEACIDRSFTALYAIARSASKVEHRYFEAFCRRLNLPLRPARSAFTRLFSPRWIEAAYECEEYAFDAVKLATLLAGRLAEAAVTVRVNTPAVGVAAWKGAGARVATAEGEEFAARWVFNATYANLKNLPDLDLRGAPELKHQITEVCLIEPPEELANLGVTVMDGPFFSTMPFPARGCHSLTHVRYTPHLTWRDDEGPRDPDASLAAHAKISRFAWMARDAARYLPCLSRARHVESLFEIKSLLTIAEVDDARPICFHRNRSVPAMISVLGGKIDNIYDVLSVISEELGLA